MVRPTTGRGKVILNREDAKDAKRRGTPDVSSWCKRAGGGLMLLAHLAEAMEFIGIVRDVKKRDGWTVLAWCVMPSHIHLVVRTSSVRLWRGMHGIQNRFSRGFNRRLGRTGGLWQGRYKAKYVEDQSYLDRLVLYVHLNRVRAGLANDPAEYPFGGHREVKREIRDPLVDIDEMLLCFGETKKAARRNYLRAIRIGIDPDAPEIESAWHPQNPRIYPAPPNRSGLSEALQDVAGRLSTCR